MEHQTKTSIKIKVKQLKGSPFLISLNPKDTIGKGVFAKVVRAYNIEEPKDDIVAKIIPLNNTAKKETI